MLFIEAENSCLSSLAQFYWKFLEWKYNEIPFNTPTADSAFVDDQGFNYLSDGSRKILTTFIDTESIDHDTKEQMDEWMT